MLCWLFIRAGIIVISPGPSLPIHPRIPKFIALSTNSSENITLFQSRCRFAIALALQITILYEAHTFSKGIFNIHLHQFVQNVPYLNVVNKLKIRWKMLLLLLHKLSRWHATINFSKGKTYKKKLSDFLTCNFKQLKWFYENSTDWALV